MFAVKIIRLPASAVGGTSVRCRLNCGMRGLDRYRATTHNITYGKRQEMQRNEVSILQLLHHPNLTRLVDFYKTSEYLYLIMECVEGGDLQSLMDVFSEFAAGVNADKQNLMLLRNCSKNYNYSTEMEPFSVLIPESIVASIVKDIFSGLAFLHSPKRSIVHRDIKPTNILMQFNLEQLCYDISSILNGSYEASLPSTDTIDQYSRSDSVFDEGYFREVWDRGGPESSPDISETIDKLEKQLSKQTTINGHVSEIVTMWEFCDYLAGRQSNGLRKHTVANQILSVWFDSEALISTFRKICYANIQCKISDFGLAKIKAPSKLPSSDFDFIGTAYYAAPEIVRGGDYTTQSDMWAAGVVVHQLVAGGRFPVFSDSHSKLHTLSDILNNETDIISMRLAFEPQALWMNFPDLIKVCYSPLRQS